MPRGVEARQHGIQARSLETLGSFINVRDRQAAAHANDCHRGICLAPQVLNQFMVDFCIELTKR
jgi:hypothetical protein